MAVLADVSAKPVDYLARIRELEAENLKLRAAKVRTATLKVTDKGGLSVYGLGRFPVTLYRGQWEKLIEIIPDIKAFIADNSERLAVKE